jgi:hypothetical protein
MSSSSAPIFHIGIALSGNNLDQKLANGTFPIITDIPIINQRTDVRNRKIRLMKFLI